LTHQGQKAGQSFVRGLQVPAFKDSGKGKAKAKGNKPLQPLFTSALA